jgi:hypothetical protein
VPRRTAADQRLPIVERLSSGLSAAHIASVPRGGLNSTRGEADAKLFRFASH